MPSGGAPRVQHDYLPACHTKTKGTTKGKRRPGFNIVLRIAMMGGNRPESPCRGNQGLYKSTPLTPLSIEGQSMLWALEAFLSPQHSAFAHATLLHMKAGTANIKTSIRAPGQVINSRRIGIDCDLVTSCTRQAAS